MRWIALLLCLMVVAPPPADAQPVDLSKGVYNALTPITNKEWLETNVVYGTVTARELRWLWVLLKKDEAAVLEDMKSPYLYGVKEELWPEVMKKAYPNTAKLRSLRRLAKSFEALVLYNDEGWTPRHHNLLPGDFLVFALPWLGTGEIIMVKTWDRQKGRGTVTGWDEKTEAWVDNPDYFLVPSEKDIKRKPGEDATLDAFDAPGKKRYVRPGLLWLRHK
jgi:hypothetical protein